MTNITKQLKKATKDIRLSNTEKASIKNALISNMEANPVRFEEVERHQLHKAYGIPSPFLNNNFRNKKTMPILALLGLLMSGSAASFAAENTVPGDMLYPVKIHVNENVMSAVAVTPKAQAELDVKLVDRRLQEVEKLATTGNVSEEAQKNAVDNLKKFTDRAKENVTKFEDENDTEDAVLTSTQLANLFKAHESIIASLNTVATSTSTSVSTATSTATTTNATASTTPTVPTVNADMLKDLLKTVHDSHKDVEDHHSELKNKIELDDEEDDMPMPVRKTSTSTPSTSTSTATSTVSTSTSPVISHEEHEDNSIFGKVKEMFSGDKGKPEVNAEQANKQQAEIKAESKTENKIENKTEKVEDDNQ